ncbi:2-isopropylmalate synthase [bacterium]|nr:2-isopropylmalate synthase [bacterium]
MSWLIQEKKNAWREPTGKKKEVVQRDTPELFRESYPYSEPPRVRFDHKTVPMDPPEQIYITSTTFRDGQQARPPYTVEQTVELFKLEHKLSGPKGIIRKTEFFLYSEKDREAVRKCQELGVEFPKVTGWIRANPSDFKLVQGMGLKETGMLTSISDYHIYKKFKKTRQQVIDDFLKVVDAALADGLEIRCHFEDITRADFYGCVVPFAQILMERSKEAKIPITIRICDTMGYGVPYPGAALPRSVPKLVYGLHHDAGVPKEQLEWHGHNDFYKVLINASTAWLYGCMYANGTLLGYGERTGNTPLESLVFEYAGLRGTLDGMDTTAIHEIVDYFESEIGEDIPGNKPFVGENFNTTRAGIHADGLIKNEEIYNIFDTTKILKHPPGISITDKSGLAGVAYWISAYLGDKLGEVGKKDPRVHKVAQWVQDQYDAGRTTAISKKEMMEIVKKEF